MSKTKIIAMYLPQYHCIPENDRFWGKGFTDWTTVKAAKPLFTGHNEPRVPLDNNYYDLSLEQNVVWQAKLAKEAGVYGFGVYHYWFNDDTNILTKPAEIIRDSKDVDINYFLAWDNGNWKRSWSNVAGNDWAPMMEKEEEKKSGPTILIEYILGGESSWKKHYDSLSSHFHNERYIKVDNKPMFIIFNYDDNIRRMCAYWDELAKAEGFDGMHIIIKRKKGVEVPDNFSLFKYEPLDSGWSKNNWPLIINNKIRRILGMPVKLRLFDYDKIWKNLISNAKKDTERRLYHGCFVSYDDSPRRGRRGTIVKGNTPEKFANYIKTLLEISDKQHKEFIFLTAWNEWGEGAYLEPDTLNKYSYLESLKTL